MYGSAQHQGHISDSRVTVGRFSSDTGSVRIDLNEWPGCILLEIEREAFDLLTDDKIVADESFRIFTDLLNRLHARAQIPVERIDG